MPEPHYNYLVAKPHRWRKQLSLKGRNMTVGQLVATMRANKMTPEYAADDFDLPLAQILEALDYYERNRELVDWELRQDRIRAIAAGIAVDPPPLSR